MRKHSNGFWEADVHFMGMIKEKNCFFTSNLSPKEVVALSAKSLKNIEEVRFKNHNNLGKILNIKCQVDNDTSIIFVLTKSKNLHSIFSLERK
jgi:hypothetical protein